MKATPSIGRGRSAFVLGALTVLLAGALWLGLTAPPSAFGQVPDSGAQRVEMLRELRAINSKLTDIAAILREIRDGPKAGPKAGKLKAGAKGTPLTHP